ncbi:MAG: PDZ domain-containing protein [Gemmatimonadales bacterium]
MLRYFVLTAGVWLAGASFSRGAAQEPVRGEVFEGDSIELHLDRGADRMLQVVMNRRARLGIKINLRARDTDSVGAYVEAVTPSGPAAKAGIRSGDIVTKVDGKSVLAGGQAEGGARESLPGLRLIELAARLAPNDTVPVEFRRGKDRKTVSVVTADEPDMLFQGAAPGGRSFAFRLRPDGPRRTVTTLEGDLEDRLGARPFLSGAALSDLELAPLNPDLGRYFGATEGVLVISIPKDSRLNLRGGDVVLAVDGRKPAGPSHLLRILRSYEQGESFKLDILRNGKRETVSGQVGPTSDR